MFRTSAKFRMLHAFRLHIRRVAPGLPQTVAANDNQRPALRRQGGRQPLICRWSAVDGGTRLACRWEKEADAPGPSPARRPARPALAPVSRRSSQAHTLHTDVVEPSYSKKGRGAGRLQQQTGGSAPFEDGKNLRDSIVLQARH
jgi:hypothetical protein